MIGNDAFSVITKNPSRKAWIIWADWVIYKMFFFLNLSAIIPPKQTRNALVIRGRPDTIPTQKDEWVILRTSQVKATYCSHDPVKEMAWPVRKRRKFRVAIFLSKNISSL